MFRRVEGHQFFTSGAVIERHVHRGAYATIVLAGRYLEAGDGGRRRVEAGDVVIHTPFEAHANRFAPIVGDLFNVALDDRSSLALTSGCTVDPDALVREIRDDPRRAATIIAARIAPTRRAEEHVADRLAAHLAADDPDPLAGWAEGHGVPARTLRRQFAQLYDVTPAHYRARGRALRAWRRIAFEATPLAAIACDCGFADQAHMTRAICTLTGAPPRHWRMAV